MNARTLLALLLATLAASGCLVDNTASVTITSACSPPAPDPASGCLYPATCDTVMLGNLWVDTTYGPTGGTLVWPFQIDNQRPDNKTADGLSTTSTAYVTDYKITYSSASVAIPDVTVPWTTMSVQPVGSTVVIIPVIPEGVATLLSANPALQADVRAELRAKGHYGDGTKFETGPFSVLVQVRNGLFGGYACPVATPTLAGVCPQAGQSAAILCQ